MSEQRVLVIANPAELRLDLGRIRIDRDGHEPAFVLPADIAVLILEARIATLSVAVLAALAEAQAMVMVCDDRHMPIALQLPLTSNFVSAGRLRLQIEFDRGEQKSRIWQQLVAAKIANSALALRRLDRNGALRLERMASEVQPGDPNNLEAQAAKHYWQNLFPNGFKRSKQGADDPINIRLNYGYAVLRAMIARSLVAAGLNGALGVGHHQSGNEFNLADDLIEAYRFLVDIAVAQWADANKILAESDTPLPAPDFIGKEKLALLEFVKTAVRINNQDMRLNSAIDLTVTSLVNLLEGKVKKLHLPSGFL
ncbi:MAG: type II CRISPR-associated endonuclease Cas1 [Candidatus Pacebacteria bacterium]|nr:type II CRISPR-associated endonuclease Cas1 [Candidatus Paceibacterota bacterium]